MNAEVGIFLCMQLMGSKPKAAQVRTGLEFIDLCKRTGLKPNEFIITSFYGGTFIYYDRLLKRANAVDFNDILLLVKQLLDQHPNVLTRLQAR